MSKETHKGHMLKSLNISNTDKKNHNAWCTSWGPAGSLGSASDEAHRSKHTKGHFWAYTKLFQQVLHMTGDVYMVT